MLFRAESGESTAVSIRGVSRAERRGGTRTGLGRQRAAGQPSWAAPGGGASRRGGVRAYLNRQRHTVSSRLDPRTNDKMPSRGGGRTRGSRHELSTEVQVARPAVLGKDFVMGLRLPVPAQSRERQWTWVRGPDAVPQRTGADHQPISQLCARATVHRSTARAASSAPLSALSAHLSALSAPLSALSGHL